MFRITTTDNLQRFSGVFHCEDYPSESIQKSFLLSTLAPNLLPNATLTSLKFLKADEYPTLLCSWEGSGIDHTKKYSFDTSFQINEIRSISDRISEEFLTSAGLEKYITHKNPVIRDIAKREIRDGRLL